MITAKDACANTHTIRNELMDELKKEIEREVLRSIRASSFSAVVEYGTFLDTTQLEELSDYLKGLGYNVEACTFDTIKFSWLVD